MNILVFQIVLLLLLAFLGGCALGCWLKRIFTAQEIGVSIPVPPELLVTEPEEDETAAESMEDETAEVPAVSDDAQPSAASSPVPADDQPAAEKTAAKADTMAATGKEAATADGSPKQEEKTPTPEPAISEPEKETSAPVDEERGELIEVATDGELGGRQPKGFREPRDGKADDLKKIRGIGKVNESKLNSAGIWHADQIAAWTDQEAEWIDGYLGFPGRVAREDWIGQAKALAEGKATSAKS